MSYDVETGVALPPETGEQPSAAAGYNAEYKRGYLSAFHRSQLMSPADCGREKDRLRGHNGFSKGWRDYFREHH